MSDDIKDAALKSLRWRLEDIREMLMSRGVGGERIYGCDEWSTPTVNLQHAINLIDAASPVSAPPANDARFWAVVPQGASRLHSKDLQ